MKDEYNIHWLLYDITRGHFKSKWLCKHNRHLYMIRSKYKIEKEEIKEDGVKIIKNHRIWLPPYYKCYCCRKEIHNER